MENTNGTVYGAAVVERNFLLQECFFSVIIIMYPKFTKLFFVGIMYVTVFYLIQNIISIFPFF